MKVHGRTILIVVLLLLGGYATYDFQQDKKKEEKNLQSSRLVTVNFEQVNHIELHKGTEQIILDRNVDGWELTTPLKDNADNTVAEDFIKNSVPERIIEVAKEGDGIDWALYGLDKPFGTVIFKTSAGQQNIFEISEKRNFEENVFARRDHENKVIVINSVWQTRLKKTPMEFRDRRFLRHKIASVDEIQLKNSQGLLELKRVNGLWMIATKKQLKLDQNKVRDFLMTIAEAKAAEIYENKSSVPNAKSLFTLDLTLAEKRWHADVTQAKDLGIYAQVSEPLQSMKMEAGALDKLMKANEEDFKEKDKK